MRDRTPVIAEVHEFVAKFCGVKVEDLLLDLDLYADLGVFGDDVDELFLEFMDRFELTSEGLDLRDCFPGEGWGCFVPLWVGFQPKRRVRIEHLVLAVEQKRWPQMETITQSARELG